MGSVYTFGKEERLKSSIRIQSLIRGGKTVSLFPFKIFWDYTSGPHKSPASVAISVPKRKFRRAVDRNLMKRRIREAYRLNKNILYKPLSEKELNIQLVVLFLSEEFISFHELQNRMREVLDKLADKL